MAIARCIRKQYVHKGHVEAVYIESNDKQLDCKDHCEHVCGHIRVSKCAHEHIVTWRYNEQHELENV